MVKIVIVGKGKSFKTANVNKFTVETLYKKCKFRSADNFERRTTWKLDSNTNVSVYAKDMGRANTENKFDFPPPIDKDLYYGNVALVAHTGDELETDNVVNFTDEQWTKLYDKLLGGVEDLGNEDSAYSSEEEIDPENLTKEGYEKDGFVVSDGDENKKITIYNSDEDSDFDPDNVSEEDYSASGEDEYEGDDEEIGENKDDEEEKDAEDEEEEDEDDEEEDEGSDEGSDDENSDLSEEEYEYD